MGVVKNGFQGFGKLVIGLGVLGGGISWLATFIYFLSEEEVVLAALTFLAPPSTIVTAFVANSALGILGVASLGAMFLGAAMAGDSL